MLAEKAGGLANLYELNTPSGQVLLKYYNMFLENEVKRNLPSSGALHDAAQCSSYMIGICQNIYGVTRPKYAKQNPEAKLHNIDDTMTRYIKYAENPKDPTHISKADANALREQLKVLRKKYIEFTGYKE